MPHLTFALWNTKRAASAAQQPAEAEADTPWRNNIQRWRLAVASSNTIFLYDFLYDGTVDVFSPAFSLSMPVENYTLQASSVQLPAGYALKSARSGTTDLLKEPLRVTARGAAPVVITLAAASPPPWVKLEGRLTDLDKLKGTPTEIAILNADLPAPMTAKIGPDGRFEFPMALRGTYDVYLRPVTDSFRRTLTIDGAGVVNLEMSAVPPLMTVSGKLTGIPEKHGYEIEAALVSKTYGCDSLWGPCFQSAGPSLVTGLMDGSFAFNEVQAGDYRSLVRVCNPGSAEARRAVKPGNTVSLPAPPEWLATPSCSTFEGPPVYVTNRDVSMMFPVDSLFSMERHTRTVIGRLTLEGKPIPLRFSLQLVDSQQQATSRPTLVESSSEGTFWFKAVDGEYNVTVNLPFGATIQSFVRGNADLLKQPLRVTWANKNDVLLELSLGPKNQLSTVSGRVSGTDSARSPVNLILAGGSFSQSFETALNRDGTFAISGVPPGLYELALGGGLKRNVSGTILIGEFVADRIHRAEDVRGLEIVVPPVEDEPAILRNPR
jgi:hypothetical protein